MEELNASNQTKTTSESQTKPRRVIKINSWHHRKLAFNEEKVRIFTKNIQDIEIDELNEGDTRGVLKKLLHKDAPDTRIIHISEDMASSRMKNSDELRATKRSNMHSSHSKLPPKAPALKDINIQQKKHHHLISRQNTGDSIQNSSASSTRATRKKDRAALL